MTNKPTPLDLDHLEALHAEWHDDTGQRHLRDVVNYHAERMYGVALEFHDQSRRTVAKTATYIAALHNALPALAAEVRRLRGENERLTRVVAKDGNLQEFADADQALWHAEQELAVLRDVEKEARELARWDWLPLLADDPNADDVRSGVKSLTTALAKVPR